MFGGLLNLLEDVGTGAAVLVTTVVAGAIAVVATLQVTGGTPYSQEDLDRRAAAYEVQAQQPSAAPEPTSDQVDSADTVALEEELEDEKLRADRLQRQSDAWEDKWTAAQRRITELREELTALQEATGGALGPDGLPLPGTPGTPGTGGAPEPGATEVTATGTISSTWTLAEAAKPWPAACGIPQGSYAVRVLDDRGESVATGSVTASDLVKRKEQKGTLTLVCQLSYQAVLPFPATAATYEFQAVATSAPKTPLYSAVVPAATVTGGAAPSLVVSLTR
jgi:hypothetical protein